MSQCSSNNNVNDIINKYMHVGWHKLTELFLDDKKYGKEKRLKSTVDENLLTLLSAVRKYIVHSQFSCYRLPNQYILASGSNTIVSDYDCVIIGSDSYITLEKMFNAFLRKYNDTLPYTFDVNIYVGGLYTVINSNKYLKRNVYVNPEFKEKDVEFFYIDGHSDLISWALIKLFQNNITKDKISSFVKLSEYEKQTKELMIECDSMYASSYEKVKHKYKYNKFTLDIITKYKLQVQYGKMVNDLMYKNIVMSPERMKELRKLMCLVQYFSVESLYTYSSFNVVVLELQNKIRDLGLKKVDYICSAIENLGDFLHHYEVESINSSENHQKKLLLKYSKYIYRIYYSLSKTKKKRVFKSDFEKKANAIYEKVVRFRGTKNIDNINFSIMEEMPFNVIRFTSKILGYIENALN